MIKGTVGDEYFLKLVCVSELRVVETEDLRNFLKKIMQ